MSKLVFEHAITSSLGSIRYRSVSTGTEPNLTILNTLSTEFFLGTDWYRFLRNRMNLGTGEPNRSVR
jgi:hypothetical protein